MSILSDLYSERARFLAEIERLRQELQLNLEALSRAKSEASLDREGGEE